MRALHRKLIRDLLRMKGQVIAIAMVIACGAATFVMSVSTLQSLIRTKDQYETGYRFPHVFAHLKRAPNALARQLAEIPGVETVVTRVVVDVNLDVPGMVEPALGRLVSIQAGPRPQPLSQLHLRRGRHIEPNAEGEVLASESFCNAHGLNPGDRVRAIINGRRQDLRMVGVALSTEYIYSIRPGDILPDDRRFGVFWMEDRQLAAAFDLDGAFNDLIMSLRPGGSEPEVLDRVDALTERYGGIGAYSREDQASNHFVTNEIRGLVTMAVIVPSIFMSVAAFLLHIVVSRLVTTQREQIAALKAFGYANGQIGVHYLMLGLGIVIVGVAVGSCIGAWLGHEITHMYTRFFHFPVFAYQLDPIVVLGALGLATLAAVAATLNAVRRAARLPPAQAMRPEPPATYRPTIIERLGLQRLFTPAARMVLRQIERRPAKTVLSIAGIAMAAAVLVVGAYMEDSINTAIDIEFAQSQRQDVTVRFVEPTSRRSLAELTHLPGVRRAEPFRVVPTRMTAGHRTRRVAIQGLPNDGDLHRLIDLGRHEVSLPPAGLIVSTKLAELLEVDVGQMVRVEVMEQSRPVRQVPVVGLFDNFAGLTAYMNLEALNRLMREQDAVSGAQLAVDPAAVVALYHRLKRTPQVAGVTIKSGIVDTFNQTVAENLLVMRMFNVIFACVIACGVVYNTVRISLSERARELATLRVIGFTGAEVSAILLGELAVVTLVAIPAGLLLGYGFAALVCLAYNTELFRMPLVVEPATYGFAAVVVLLAAIGSGLLVRRHVDHLNLPAVLKAAE